MWPPIAPSIGSTRFNVPDGFGVVDAAVAGADGVTAGAAAGEAGAELLLPPHAAAPRRAKRASERTVTDRIMIDDARARSPRLQEGRITQRRSLPAANGRSPRNTPPPPSTTRPAPSRHRPRTPAVCWQPSLDS